MSTAEIKIKKVENDLDTIIEKAPYLVKKNSMFTGLVSLSGDLIEILKDQQNEITELRQALYITQGQVDDLEAES